jgi:hypothetical protein
MTLSGVDESVEKKWSKIKSDGKSKKALTNDQITADRVCG